MSIEIYVYIDTKKHNLQLPPCLCSKSKKECGHTKLQCIFLVTNLLQCVSVVVSLVQTEEKNTSTLLSRCALNPRGVCLRKVRAFKTSTGRFSGENACALVHFIKSVFCNVVQCVAVCCSVLQCVAVWCKVLQYVVVWCSVVPCVLQCVAAWCSVLQSVAICVSTPKCAHKH